MCDGPAWASHQAASALDERPVVVERPGSFDRPAGQCDALFVIDSERARDREPGHQPHPHRRRLLADPIERLLQQSDLGDIEEPDLEPAADRTDTQRRPPEELEVAAIPCLRGHVQEHRPGLFERARPRERLGEAQRDLRIVVAHVAGQRIHLDGLVGHRGGEGAVTGHAGP